LWGRIGWSEGVVEGLLLVSGRKIVFKVRVEIRGMGAVVRCILHI
jgi:hypothetical protein